MAIDRTGVAWVNYADGSLHKASTTDAKCTKTAFVPDGKGFGKIDLATLDIAMLGDYTGTLSKKAAELTGTADGRVYGFFTTQPATLAQIDRGSATTSSERTLDGVSFGAAFALSFSGGDFWFYTAEGTAPSKVTQLKQASGSGELVVAISDVGGFRIVGAGVPTCAPLTPPR